MGHKPKGKRGGGPSRGPRRDATADRPASNWNSVTDEDKSNAGFEEYYRKQGIFSDAEWPAFISSLRQELPLTFRVTGSRAHAETINDLIKNTHVPTMQEVKWEDKVYGPPQQLPWYPGQYAWQLSAPKRVVRKTQPFKVFQRFLVGETEVGNLSRQEAVSMIPPLFLDAKPHHICLDMCAAPGSKTAQIIEALNPHHTSSTGLLIANDSDYKRTHMLVHQTGRMPSKGLMVTNLDATLIPNISLGDGKTLLFDRILADVPCSGDGTLRKNLEIWRKWTVWDGNSLHNLQLRILERAMNLLKPGGRLVYSTCSFNPIENEAVIAAGMNSHSGQFELLDLSAELPSLKRRPGLLSWKVASRKAGQSQDLVWHESQDAYGKYVAELDAEKDEDERGKIRPMEKTLWTPENAPELHLERCMRLLPHDQDTGGFFVAVLHKLGPASSANSPISTTAKLPEPQPAPALDEDVIIADESGTSSLKRAASPSAPEGKEDGAKRTKADGGKAPGGQKKKIKPDLGFKEDPFSFVDAGHVELQTISNWYKLEDTFPMDCMMVRNPYGDPLRSVYLTNELVKTIISNNDYTRLRLISAGCKAFTRQDSQARPDIACKWRIPSDGLLEVLPHLGEGKIRQMGMEDLRVMVHEQYPEMDKFREETRQWLEKEPLGNIIVRFEAGEGAGGVLPLPIHLPIWKARTSVSLLIDKREKSMLSLRTFGEDICQPMKPQINKKDAKGNPAEEAEATAGDDGDGVVDEDVKPEDEEGAMNA